MVFGGLDDGLRPDTARDTDSPYQPDICFLAYIVMPCAEQACDDRAVALLARKCGKMQIVRGGFRMANQRPIPGHRRHSSGIYNWLIS